MSKAFIAIDLGAESGRVIVVTLDKGQVEFNEVHRFPNTVIQLPSGLHWNVSELWRAIVDGLKKANNWCTMNSHTPLSVGVDTWGVDWALVSRSGELCGLPHSYRDARNPEAFQRIVKKLGTDLIYQTTGIQLMHINSPFLVGTFDRDDFDRCRRLGARLLRLGSAASQRQRLCQLSI